MTIKAQTLWRNIRSFDPVKIKCAFCKSFDYNSEITPDGKAIEKMIDVL